jgi:hypothetical protein
VLRDAAVVRIQRGLGFRTDQVDNIVEALQEAQRLLERGRTLPYFLLEEDQDIAVVADERSVALPERFLREHPEERMHFYDSAGALRFLEKMDFDYIHPSFVDEDSGQPTAYVLRKNTLEIFPLPDADYTLVWSYYKGAESLATNLENAWLEEEYGAPEVLIGRAGMIVAADLTNATAFAKFQAMFNEAFVGMIADGVQRDQENNPLYMNGRL